MINKYLKTLLFGVLFVIVISVASVNACLTFCITRNNDIEFGRNFDWPVDTGAVFVNQRNIQKSSIVLPPEHPISWVSKYGSVTFNQFSKEVPIGGMNEEGLVIECLVSKAEHAPADERKAINELQWIQYHLDLCKTVEEVIKSANVIRISQFAVNLHYFVTDSSGQSAVIEFINGKLVQRTGNYLQTKVLANNFYDEDLASIVKQKGLDSIIGSSPYRALSRFSRAAQMIEEYDGRITPIEYAFSTLDAVSQGNFTKWQIVYDIPRRHIYFRTLREHNIKLIEMKLFNYEHTKESMMLDINCGGEGSVQKLFKTYTTELNNDLIKNSMNEFNKAGIMQHIKAEHIEYIKKVVASCKPEALSTVYQVAPKLRDRRQDSLPLPP